MLIGLFFCVFFFATDYYFVTINICLIEIYFYIDTFALENNVTGILIKAL